MSTSPFASKTLSVKVSNIKWDSDGDDVSLLPTEFGFSVETEADDTDESLRAGAMDYVSDLSGYLILDCDISFTE